MSQERLFDIATRYAERHKIESITAKNFQLIDLRLDEARAGFGCNPMALAWQAVYRWMDEFQHGGERPFCIFASAWERDSSLRNGPPRTVEGLRESDWSDRIHALLQRVEQFMNEHQEIHSSDFDPLRERIATLRSVIARSKAEWQSEAHFISEARAQFVVGESAHIDAYVGALAERIRSLRTVDAENFPGWNDDDVVNPESQSTEGLDDNRLRGFHLPLLDLGAPLRGVKAIKFVVLSRSVEGARPPIRQDMTIRIVTVAACGPRQEVDRLLTESFAVDPLSFATTANEGETQQ